MSTSGATGHPAVGERDDLERLDEESTLIHPLRNLLADPGRGVLRVAAALIAVQFVVRLVMALRGWFVGDDYAFIGRSFEHPLFSLDYVGLAYAGHVMPLSLAWVWICSHLAPYNFVLPTVADAVLQGVTAAVVLRLLITLFDRRWVILAPFTLFLFTALTVPAFVWWAAALNQTPQQLAMACALLFHVQYLRTGKVSRGLLGALSMLLGLGFSEKTLLVSGLVAGVTFAYFTGGPVLRRLRSMVTRHWRVWLGYLVVAVPFLIYYKTSVPSPIADVKPNGSGTSTLVGNQVFHTLIPATLGGPWRWRPLGTNAALASPGNLAVEACTAVFVALLALTVARAHRAWFGWVLLLGYETVNLLLLDFSRAALVGPALGLEFRYSTDLALVTMVCGSLACIRLSPAFAERDGQFLVPRSAARAWWEEWRATDLGSTLPRVAPATAIALAVAVVATSGVYSSWKYTDIFGPNTGRVLLATARSEAKKLPADTLVSDTPVDQAAVWNMVYPYTLPSRLLRPIGVKLSYISPGQSTEHLAVLDPSGHFRAAVVAGYSAAPGGETNCGYRVGKGPTTVTMPNKTVIPWNWLVRVGYLATASGDTTITAADTTARVHVHPGAGTVYVLVSGVVSTVTFGGFDNGAELCTDAVAVGTAAALPDSTVGP